MKEITICQKTQEDFIQKNEEIKSKNENPSNILRCRKSKFFFTHLKDDKFIYFSSKPKTDYGFDGADKNKDRKIELTTVMSM